MRNQEENDVFWGNFMVHLKSGHLQVRIPSLIVTRVFDIERGGESARRQKGKLHT